MACYDPKRDYRTASFKGVPFKVSTDETTVGRRGDLYEFPHGETAAWRDLGRLAPTYTIEGYLVGDDHHRQAEAMRAAAESPGPGLLVHPIYGERLVACRSLTITHEPEGQRRVTMLSFDLVEVGDTTIFGGIAGGFGGFLSAIDEFIGVALASFRAVWQGGQALLSDRDALKRAFAAADRRVLDAVRVVAHGGAPAIDVMRRLEAGLAGTGYQTAGDVIAALDGGISAIADVDDAAMAARELKALFRWAVKQAPMATSRTAMVQEDALHSLVARLAFARYMVVFEDVDGLTVDGVLKALLDVLDAIDAEIEAAVAACDDTMLTALRRIKDAAIERFFELAYGARPVVRYAYEIDAPGGVPSLVLAHEVYGDSKRAAELEAMNVAPLAFAASRRVRVYTEP